MTGRARIVLLGLLLASCGVTREARYDPELFPPFTLSPGEVVDGKALVLTTPEDEAHMYVGKVRVHTGPSVTLTVPLGIQTRQAALRAFGKVFKEGAWNSSGPAGLDGHAAVISARVTGFTAQAVMESSTLAFEVAVQVIVRRGDGEPMLVRTYDPGTFLYRFGPLEFLTGRNEAYTYAIQYGLQVVMVEAAEDVRRCFTGGCPARPELPEPAYLDVPPRTDGRDS